MAAKKKVTKKVIKKTVNKTAKRKTSKFSRVSTIGKKVKNRFQKFYYFHRPAINKFRRDSYKDKKKKGICVKCSKKALKTSIFCSYHLARSRVYNRR